MTIDQFRVHALPNIPVRKLIATNDHERLRQLLLSRLTECGWRDEVKRQCKQVVEESDVHEINVDHIIEKVTPQARAQVPPSVKKELLTKIKQSILREISQE